MSLSSLWKKKNIPERIYTCNFEIIGDNKKKYERHKSRTVMYSASFWFGVWLLVAEKQLVSKIQIKNSS